MLALTHTLAYTMLANTPIENCTILIEHEKIIAIGQNITIPEDCRIIDARGKVITPGLIDAHTHLGVYTEGTQLSSNDFSENSEASTPAMHVVDAIHPHDPGLRRAYLAGVTTAMVAPGSGNPINGTCSIIKTKQQSSVEKMLLIRHAGLKISLGDNPKNIFKKKGRTPFTRMAIANILRENFLKAQAYLLKKETGGCEINLGYEAIGRVLRKEMPLRVHAHRTDDIMTAIRLAKEFDLELIIEHASEGNLIIDALAAAKVPIIVGPVMHARTKIELAEHDLTLAAKLDQADLPFAIMSDHPICPSEFLPTYAGICVKYGLDAQQALKAITINAAQIMKIDEYIGALAVNMHADLVVWSAHPFEYHARSEIIISNGELDILKT